MAQDSGFPIGLVVALAQAQKVEEVRVFEDLDGVGVGGFDQFGLNGRVGLQGGKLGALKGLAVDWVAPLAHAPGVGGGLAGVELAGGFGFERQQVDKMAPAQWS